MKPSPPPSVRAGFTLVELLVAIAVLSIIVVAIGQILGTATSITTNNNKHTDANAQARMVFDRMANDFARMLKRTDVDMIFFKNNASATAGTNDTMYFFSEGASYYNNNVFSVQYKNAVSLVGYRIANGTDGITAVGSSPYGQLERLGKALAWDTGQSASSAVTFLTYPPAGTTPLTATTPDSVTYSSAMYGSTLWGAYLTSGVDVNSAQTSLVGTLGNGFNDSADTNYHPIGTNVFRFEYSFLLKDGTQALFPVMTQTANNGLPTKQNLTAAVPPTFSDDSSGSYSIGSRWYDTTNHIGYICVDASKGNAIWHEIGLQDVSAIVVTIAVIDNQGLAFINTSGLDIVGTLASQFPDAQAAASVTNGDIAKALVTNWTTAIAPTSAGGTVSAGSGIPQSMVNQIRIYQRYFYLNNF